MLGANTREDGVIDGKKIKDVADCAAGCILSGEKEKCDLTHSKLFESAVQDLCFSC